MSKPVLRYETPPFLIYSDPTCSACETDCVNDGDGWECPDCGTTWGHDDYDQTGTLYAEWSGEDAKDLPLVDHDDGWIKSHELRRVSR